MSQLVQLGLEQSAWGHGYLNSVVCHVGHNSWVEPVSLAHNGSTSTSQAAGLGFIALDSPLSTLAVSIPFEPYCDNYSLAINAATSGPRRPIFLRLTIGCGSGGPRFANVMLDAAQRRDQRARLTLCTR